MIGTIIGIIVMWFLLGTIGGLLYYKTNDVTYEVTLADVFAFTILGAGSFLYVVLDFIYKVSSGIIIFNKKD